MTEQNLQTTTFTKLQLRTADADNRLQFRGRLIAAGQVRNALDEPAGITIPPEALQTAVHQDQFNNLACFIDHAGWLSGPSLRNLFGVWTDISWNNHTQGVDGTLNVYDTEPNNQIAAIFSQALDEDAAPDIGVSIVFYPIWNESGQNSPDSKRVLSRFRKIESADLVFMPAADGRILEALSALNQSTEVTQMTEETTTAPAQSDNQRPAAVQTPQFVEEQEQLSSEWLGTIKQSGLRRILADTDLPDVVKQRLAKQTYTSPADVQAAIQEAHDELQTLEQEETVQLGQRPYIYVEDPLETIQSHVSWFFGVDGAPLPPSNYRKLDQLYVAMTGDSEFYGVYQPNKVMFAADGESKPIPWHTDNARYSNDNTLSRIY